MSCNSVCTLFYRRSYLPSNRTLNLRLCTIEHSNCTYRRVQKLVYIFTSPSTSNRTPSNLRGGYTQAGPTLTENLAKKGDDAGLHGKHTIWRLNKGFPCLLKRFVLNS